MSVKFSKLSKKENENVNGGSIEKSVDYIYRVYKRETGNINGEN